MHLSAMHRQGLQVATPAATMYVWAQLPEPWAQDSVTFALSWWRQPALPLHLVLDLQIRRRVRPVCLGVQLSWKLWLREWHLLGSNRGKEEN